VCTVTVVPRRSGFRIVCNRDEQRSRPLAESPAAHRIGDVAAIWPRDPLSGGTWIGANAAGLAIAVLNRRDRGTSHLRRPLALSRGTIIPLLLGLDNLDLAVSEAARLRASAFEPFRMLIVQRKRLAVVRNSQSRIIVRRGLLERPVIFTSSSLGDHLVREPRQALFTQLVLHARSPLLGQARFHRHQWPDRPEISVCMSRQDAVTVSRTVIDVDAHRSNVRVGYTPLTHSC
jgi:hypothetical protein